MKIQICVIWLTMVFVCANALRTRKPCRLRKFERGDVCVCDDSYCDTLELPEPENREYIFVTSSSQGDRFSYKKGKLHQQRKFTQRVANILEIDSAKTYQKIRGFGAGYPEAVSYLLGRISPNMRNCLYKSYFSSDVGMGYSVLRFPIGGTDFGFEPWAYNLYPENDTKLSNFTKLDERELVRNRQFKELKEISKNHDIKILAAAWSPPIWMKQNRQWYGLKNNQIIPKYYQLWADYHIRWLELMKNDGVDMWAISTGNEPVAAGFNKMFEETYWNASYQAQWIANHFGPTIRNSKFSDLEIHGFDDSRGFALEYLDIMRRSNAKAFDYLSTISLHGYTDNLTSPKILDTIQSRFPDKQIWYTEMCFGVEFASKEPGPQLGWWDRGVDQIKILMSSFNHQTVGYIDWNFVLNSTGGPNYVAGVTDAPVILSADFKEMYKQPMFYVMAHFSKFIPPGSVRIDAKLTGSQTSSVTALAFSRPDEKITLILYNKSATANVTLTIKDKITGTFSIKLKPNSINTVVYNVENDFDDDDDSSSGIHIFILPNFWSRNRN